MEERILLTAEELFCRYGIKSITMDDIARHLGISKKTIYQFYKDKKELVHLLIEKMLEDQRVEMTSRGEGAKNAIEEIFLVLGYLRRLMQHLNPVVFYDLRKYHFDSWMLYQEFRDNYLIARVKRNLEWGAEEGIYRTNFDPEMLARLRIHQLNAVFEGQIFPAARFEMAQVLNELTEHFLYGVASPKGYKMIDTYKNSQKED